MRRPLTLLIALLTLAGVARAQTATPPPTATPLPLAETWTGRGRLSNVTFNYPADWFTVGGVPVNRFISFNVVSSVRVGLRNPLPEDEEAIVMAISGGYIDGWNEIEPDATPEDVLTAFLERLGGDSNFSGDQPDDQQSNFELQVEPRTFNGYDAVQMQFVRAPDAPTPTPNPDVDTDDEFNGQFVAYALRLDDNRFLVALTLSSEMPFDEAQPTIEAVLNSVTLDD